MEIQIQKAYLKQRGIDKNVKKTLKVKKTPYLKKVGDVVKGLAVPTLDAAREYVDKKCPYTSNVNIQGRILTGTVVSAKMTRTIVVRRDYLHYVPKYNRYEKRHKNISAHVSPLFEKLEKGGQPEVGDQVVIGQCRPLSKTVRFNVLKVTKNNNGKDKSEKKSKSFA